MSLEVRSGFASRLFYFKLLSPMPVKAEVDCAAQKTLQLPVYT